jgi:hypothetical protein
VTVASRSTRRTLNPQACHPGRDVDLAWVGPFLLLHVPPEQRASYERVATLLVNDIEAAASIVRSSGGTILEGPAEAPKGSRMIAEHPGDAIFD